MNERHYMCKQVTSISHSSSLIVQCQQTIIQGFPMGFAKCITNLVNLLGLPHAGRTSNTEYSLSNENNSWIISRNLLEMYPSLQRHFYLGKYNNELILKTKTQFMSSIIAIHSKSPPSIMVFFLLRYNWYNIVYILEEHVHFIHLYTTIWLPPEC